MCYQSYSGEICMRRAQAIHLIIQIIEIYKFDAINLIFMSALWLLSDCNKSMKEF